ARGPLVRMILLRFSETEHILLLTMHHIISDNWSMEIFVRELMQLYNAFVVGKPSPLPELPMQYADFAVWQRAWLQGEVLQAQLDYWTLQLQDLPILDLPTDALRPPVQRSLGAVEVSELPLVLTRQLKVLSRQEGVTFFMTLLAAFQLLLARYSGQEDIVVG